ncbi:hypothetical protein K474DRAFT_1673593 [Panus rudis PR-1116 ss-1]|nr:hypothetical protein K474DRAFT_1673593 [Panus rudis PR-1116 ss-1]
MTGLVPSGSSRKGGDAVGTRAEYVQYSSVGDVSTIILGIVLAMLAVAHLAKYKMMARGIVAFYGEPPPPSWKIQQSVTKPPLVVIQAIQELLRLRKAAESREYHKKLLHALITRPKASPVQQIAELLDAYDCSLEMVCQHLSVSPLSCALN